MAIHKHLLWLISLCIANLSHAMQPIVLTGNAHTYELPGHIDVLEDEAGNWTIDDIMAPERGSQFLPNANGILRIEGLNTAHWLRFKVQNTSVESRHMILEVRPHSLNYLDVYVSSESGLKRWKAGDALAFHERFVEYRQFIFPLTIASNQTSTVYVRIKSNARTRVSAILVDATEFLLKSHEETLIAGIM
ncbi:MAG: 7TM-DISM domain-containing protein [Pseudomonadota bacterium]